MYLLYELARDDDTINIELLKLSVLYEPGTLNGELLVGSENTFSRHFIGHVGITPAEVMERAQITSRWKPDFAVVGFVYRKHGQFKLFGVKATHEKSDMIFKVYKGGFKNGMAKGWLEKVISKVVARTNAFSKSCE